MLYSLAWSQSAWNMRIIDNFDAASNFGTSSKEFAQCEAGITKPATPQPQGKLLIVSNLAAGPACKMSVYFAFQTWETIVSQNLDEIARGAGFLYIIICPRDFKNTPPNAQISDPTCPSPQAGRLQAGSDDFPISPHATPGSLKNSSPHHTEYRLLASHCLLQYN